MPLVNAKTEFEDVLFYDIAKTIFGIIPESIEENLKLSTFHAICERFIGISVSDIALAFKTHVQEEKIYTLTRDEFIKPITNYWKKKQIVLRELNKEIESINEMAFHEQTKLQFKEDAMKLYLECLNNGTEWTGTPFQASSFAQNFAHRFDQEEKDAVWTWAKKEAHRMKVESANKFTTELAELAELLISDKHLFCNEIVNRALLRKLQLIMD